MNAESPFGIWNKPLGDREKGGGEKRSQCLRCNYDNKGREESWNIFIDALYIGFRMDCFIYLKLAVLSCHLLLLLRM